VATALTFSGSAAGQESLSDLKARMESIQGELDATTVKIEKLRDETDELTAEIAEIEHRKAQLEQNREELMDDAIARANELYRTGSVETLEILFSAEDFGQLADRAELLSQISMEDAGVFVELSRTDAELEVLNEDLLARRRELVQNADALARENERLQAQFQGVASEYQMLRRKLARQTPDPAPVAASNGGSGGSAPNVKVKITGDMTCPVAGPHSFVDSWGAPRSGHTHQGVDMMADYGTPLVAITSGTATYVAFDGSGGNMIFLDGDDGNSYWYMHNQENFVREGQHVETGESIGTVGDTGNAAGTPHLHFEFHPGGGAAVNPYPLVASLC